MSNTNSPEKLDPKHSIIINTSTQSGKVNLSVVLKIIQNQPPSLSSDSNNEIIPPEKVVSKTHTSKKLNTIISFPHQIPGLSYLLVNSEIWVYSFISTESKIVKKIEYPEILSLKLVESKLEKDPILKPIRDAIRDRNSRAKEFISKIVQYYAQHYNDCK